MLLNAIIVNLFKQKREINLLPKHWQNILVIDFYMKCWNCKMINWRRGIPIWYNCANFYTFQTNAIYQWKYKHNCSQINTSFRSHFLFPGYPLSTRTYLTQNMHTNSALVLFHVTNGYPSSLQCLDHIYFSFQPYRFLLHFSGFKHTQF